MNNPAPPVEPGLVVLISGGGSNLQAIMDATASGRVGARVDAVISDNDQAFGLQRARDAGIPAIPLPRPDYASREAFEGDLARNIDRYQPALIVLAGFMRILSAGFVNQYAGRIVNIHPSLLPDFKGTHTHQRVLDASQQEHGASVHLVTEMLDDGPVILQAKVPVLEHDDAESLATRVLEQEHRIYPRAIQMLLDGQVIVSGKTLEFVEAGNPGPKAE